MRGHEWHDRLRINVRGVGLSGLILLVAVWLFPLWWALSAEIFATKGGNLWLGCGIGFILQLAWARVAIYTGALESALRRATGTAD